MPLVMKSVEMTAVMREINVDPSTLTHTQPPLDNILTNHRNSAYLKHNLCLKTHLSPYTDPPHT